MTERNEKKAHFKECAINNAANNSVSTWCYDISDEGKEYYVTATNYSNAGENRVVDVTWWSKG